MPFILDFRPLRIRTDGREGRTHGGEKTDETRVLEEEIERGTNDAIDAQVGASVRVRADPATMVMNLDALGNARWTLTSLTSVSGVKAVLERVGMFGPATIAAWTKIEAEHFGGAGMGAMMKALKR